jgi:hypothetical protein
MATNLNAFVARAKDLRREQKFLIQVDEPCCADDCCADFRGADNVAARRVSHDCGRVFFFALLSARGSCSCSTWPRHA